MDPDLALRQLREYAGEVMSAREGDPFDEVAESNELALARRFTELDEHLLAGGHRPAEWTRRRGA